MADNTFQEISAPYFGRKILQANAPASFFDASQPGFIVLLCITIVLTIVLVVIIIIFYRRFYSHRGKTPKDVHSPSDRFQQISSTEKNRLSPASVPIVSTLAPSSSSPSSYSVTVIGQSSSNRHDCGQNLPVNTLPSCRLQHTTIDAFLNDINLFSSETIDVRKLNSFLFIDLHSASSDTFPDHVFQQFPNNTTARVQSERHYYAQRSYLHHQQQPRRSSLALKRSYGPRFLMRERYLSSNLSTLPQLRQRTMQQQKHLFGIDDSYNSSTTIISQTLQSTNIFTTNNDNQNRILHTINEERPYISFYPHQYATTEPYFFEIVSTSRDHENDLEISYQYPPFQNTGTAYIDDSILV